MKTSGADFKKFTANVGSWMQALGLHEWDYGCEHEHIEDGAWAQCDNDLKSMSAVFTLNTSVPTSIKEEMPVLALHEVLECLLAKLDELAQDRRFDADQWESERHVVINRLITLIQRSNLWE